METDETRNIIAEKLTNFFCSFLTNMEQKLPNDYESLREISIEYTQMYHELYNEILPKIESHLKEKIESSKNVNQNSRRDLRSKTPARTPIRTQTKNILNTNTNRSSPKNNQLTPKVSGGSMSTSFNKSKKIQIPLQKSCNNVSTTINKLQAKTPRGNNSKIVYSKKIEVTTNNTKHTKRDMTPVPQRKTNPLDISQESLKGNPGNKLNKIDSKKPSVTSLAVKNAINNSKIGKSNHSHAVSVPKIEVLEVQVPPHDDKNDVENSCNNEAKIIKDKLINNNTQSILNLINEKKKTSINFSTNYIKSIYLMLKKNYLPLTQRIKITISSKEIYEKLGLKKYGHELIKEFDMKLKRLNEDPLAKYINDKEIIENFLKKQFTPSKTAQNGLNFVTKEEELNLSKKDQSDEILNIFRLIYILVDEPYEDIQPQKLIQNLTTVIFERLGVENLKSLFLNSLPKNTDFSQSQFIKISNIVQECPKILSPQDLLKINRSVSYMTFILKELYEYISAKTPNGEPIFYIRKLFNKITHLNKKREKMLHYISN